MKEIQTNGIEVLFVEVPEDAYNFRLKNGYIWYDDPKLDNRIAVIFRNNSWSTVIGDNWIKTHSITHWMPLPEKPKQ
jgi:hypothetical protein